MDILPKLASTKEEDCQQVWIESYPELQASDRLHLPVIRAVEIPFRCSDIRMAHERLDCLEVIPVVQEVRGKHVPHDVGVNPLLDQGPFYHGFDEAVNRFRRQSPFLVGTMLAECLEERMVCQIPLLNWRIRYLTLGTWSAKFP